MLVVLLTGLLTTWGKIQRLEQRLDDADRDRVTMIDTLNRIEQRLYTLGK